MDTRSPRAWTERLPSGSEYAPARNGPPPSSATRVPGSKAAPRIVTTVGALVVPRGGLTVRVEGSSDQAIAAARSRMVPPAATAKRPPRGFIGRGSRDDPELREPEPAVAGEDGVDLRGVGPHVLAQDLPEDRPVVGAVREVAAVLGEHDAGRPGGGSAVVHAAHDRPSGGEQARRHGVVGADAAVFLGGAPEL